MSDERKIANIVLDESCRIRRSPRVEHERQVAVYDLLEANHFAPLGAGLSGPYTLHLRLAEGRLTFDLSDGDERPLTTVGLPLAPFRRIIKDYVLVCESYYSAIKTKLPSQIEAIDMGRRGLHNEGAEMLRERLADKIEMDVKTSRRLFTLICVLHVRD